MRDGDAAMIKVEQNSYSIAIDPAGERAWIRFRGVVGFETTLDGLREILEHEAFTPSMRVMVDFAEVPRIDLDASHLRSLSNEMKKLEKRPAVATLVTGEDTGRYLLGKLYCSLAVVFSGRTIHRKCFRSADAAVQWMDSFSTGALLETS